MFGLGEFLPSHSVIDWLASYTRAKSSPGLYQSIIFIICGLDESQMEAKLMQTIMKHTPAGTSTRSQFHNLAKVLERFDVLKA